jgi:ABC-type antimicrobial peptide transport system permease subunit
VVLAGLGLYGVTAYAVSRRWKEIGIRIAIGATGRSVTRLVVSRLALLTTAGLLLGALSGAWAARFISTLLFEVAPRDPATLVMSASVMAAVATLAGWLPARRAMRMAPSTILRAD